jgi:hypothetical protein
MNKKNIYGIIFEQAIANVKVKIRAGTRGEGARSGLGWGG